MTTALLIMLASFAGHTAGDKPAINGNAYVLAGRSYTYTLKCDDKACEDGKAVWTVGEGAKIRKGAGEVQALMTPDEREPVIDGTDAMHAIFVKVHSATSGSFKVMAKFNGADLDPLTVQVVPDLTDLKIALKDGATFTSAEVGKTYELKVKSDKNQDQVKVKPVGTAPAIVVVKSGFKVLTPKDVQPNDKGESQFQVNVGEQFTVECLASGTYEMSVNAVASSQSKPNEFQTIGVAADIARVEIDPKVQVLRRGQTRDFTATAYDSDNNRIDGATFTWRSRSQKVTIPQTTASTVKVTGKDVGPDALMVTATRKQGDAVGTKEATCELSVTAKFESLAVELDASVLVVGTKTPLQVRLLDTNNNRIDPAEARIEVTSSPNLTVSPDTVTGRKDRFIVTALAADAKASVTFSAKLSDAEDEVTRTVEFKIVTVSDFVPVVVDLDMMDEQTAKLTFGGAVASQYYVMSVRVLNNVRAFENGSRADSILVYGQSFDTGVEFGYKERKSDKTFKAVTIDDVLRDFTLANANGENGIPQRFQSQTIPLTGNHQASVRKASDLVLVVGEHLRFKIDSLPTDAKTKWSMATQTDESRATITEDGQLTGRSPGPVNVCVEITDKKPPVKLTLTVLVLPADGELIQLGATGPTINIATESVYRVVPPSDTKLDDYEFVVPSGSTTFDKLSGLVRVLNPGRVVITGTPKDGAKKGLPVVSAILIAHSRDVNGDLPPSVFEGASGLKQVRARLRYRPISQEIMLLSQDQRAFHSSENLLGRLLGGASQALGFFIGRGDIDSRGTVGAFLSLAPGLGTLFFPDQSPANRNAILTQSMKALEEVPFGGELRRVVFFPKGEISGILKDRKVRITAVDTSRYRIAVGIVQKLGTVSGENKAEAKKEGETKATGSGGFNP